MNGKDGSIKPPIPLRNQFAKVLGNLSERIKVQEAQLSKPLPKSIVNLSTDPVSPAEIKDRLYGPYIDQLRQFILSLKAPFVLSINGTWGRGKTFLIEHVLKHEAVSLECALARIDAWEIPEGEPAMPHILAQIAEQLGAGERDKKTLIAAGTAVAWVGTTLAGTQPLGFLILALTAWLKRNVGSIAERSGKIKELRSRFGAMIGNHLAKNKKASLIVFIDNLDRCSPEQCIGFLDQLAKFLKTKDCIFILALDEEVVEGAIRLRYGAGSKVTANSYLEKIIDLSLTPPAPQPTGLLELLGDRFDQFTMSPDLRADMRNALNQLAMAHSLMVSEFAKNPRKMFRILKRIAAFFHFNGVSRLEKLEHMIPGILLMCIIKAYKPLLFDALRRNPQTSTEMILLQNVGRQVVSNGYNIGNITPGDRNARKDNIRFPFRDPSFIDDPECISLLNSLLDDFSRRRDIYKSAGANEFHEAILKLGEIVETMKV